MGTISRGRLGASLASLCGSRFEKIEVATEIPIIRPMKPMNLREFEGGRQRRGQLDS